VNSSANGAVGAHEAIARFDRARGMEPHPLFASADEAEDYVRGVQQADSDLAAFLAREPGLSRAERAAIERRRNSADTVVARQVELAARRMSRNRDEALAALAALFRLGAVPTMDTMDGSYQGALVTGTLFGPLDTLGRFMKQLYMPWVGKRFYSNHSMGENIFKPGMRMWGRLLWPKYAAYEPLGEDLVTAFPFHTYTGEGLLDTGTSVLKLDYNLSGNPAFIVRDALDELVQITGGYFLGKAYLCSDRPRLAAYFALRKES
jgi:hypothetical protein